MSRHRSVAGLLTTLVAVGAAAASGVGLLRPEIYAKLGEMQAPAQGQDLVTLVAAMVLGGVPYAVPRGHAGARPSPPTAPLRLMTWAGLLGYMLYTYAGASFAYPLTALLPAHLVLFSASVFGLVALASEVSSGGESSFGGMGQGDSAGERLVARGTWPVVGFLIFFAVVLLVPWAVQIAAAVASDSELAVPRFICVFDVGLVVPASLVAAARLSRARLDGPLVAGGVLVFGAAMSVALLSMTWFGVRAGVTEGAEFTGLWFVLAGGNLAALAWLVRPDRHAKPRSDRP